jgi:3-methyladenine DNA glycosylase AlkD
MNYRETMRQLRAMGTAQNRKVYRRHGVGRRMFGVSYANLGKLSKAIKVDQELAVRLWDSGNHDACVLATMVADPSRMTSRQLDAWARELDSYVLADAFAGLVARSGMARRKFEQWRDRKGEFVGQVAWGLLSRLAQSDADLPDHYFEEQLATIEGEVHDRKNRVRYSMNMALIAIGMRGPGLEKKAIAAAKRIGPVEVNHGETGCKTPDPIPYIARAKARRKQKAAKKRK